MLVARNYPNNIENEKRLLTFTAWYCIVKNKLFADKEYLTLLEYDVILDDSFFSNMNDQCSKKVSDAFGFMYSPFCYGWVERKPHYDVFLGKKNMKVPPNIYYDWFPTTNLCLRYDIIEQFVDWYYPDCKILQESDPNFFSHYHERLTSYFVKEMGYKIIYTSGLKHLFSGSHYGFTEGF
jgi:hypothetical protein